MELDSANSVSYSKQSSISLPGCPGDEFVVEFEEYTCQLCKGSTHKQAGMRWPRDHGEISNKYPAVMIFVILPPFCFPKLSSLFFARFHRPRIILVQFLAHTTSQDHYQSIRTLPEPNPSPQPRVRNHLLPLVIVVLGGRR